MQLANSRVKALISANTLSFNGFTDEEIKAIVIAVEKILAALEESPSLDLDDELLDVTSIFGLQNITPTPRQLAEMLGDVAKQIIRMMQTLSMVPARECIALLHQALQQSILILRRLIRHTNNNYPTSISDLCDVIPQILAAAAVVVPSLGQEATKLLRTDPKDILNVLSKLVDSSILLNDKEKRDEFSQASLELLGIFTDIDVSIVDKPESSLVRAIASLVIAIQSDAKAAITELQKYIHGLKTRSEIRKEKFDCPQYEGPYSQQKINDLIDFVIKNTPDVYKQLDSIENPQQAIESMTKYSSEFSSIISDAKQRQEKKKAKTDFLSLIASAGAAESIASRGFLLTNSSPSVQLSAFVASISSIFSLAEWSNDPSKQRELRRATRSLNRKIGTLQDFLEDTEQEQASSPFANARISAAHSVVKIAEQALATTSLYGNSLLPQAYVAIISPHAPEFEKYIKDLTEAINEFCDMNTNEEAAQNMKNIRIRLS